MQRFIVVLLCFTLTSCALNPIRTIHQNADTDFANHELLTVGQTVKVFTNNGEIHNFVLTSKSNTELRGDGITIPMNNISHIEVVQPLKLTGIIVLIVVVAALGYYLSNNTVFLPAATP